MTNTYGPYTSVDGVLGIWTQDRNMEGADESTQLWWVQNLWTIQRRDRIQFDSEERKNETVEWTFCILKDSEKLIHGAL